MPQTAVTIRNIQSYNPEIDPRSTDQVYVLDGKNFAWDARGPYSAYASRLLDTDTVIDTPPHVTQGIPLGDVHLTMTFEDVYTWDSVNGWVSIYTLTPPANPYTVPLNNMRWTWAYLQAGSYVCAPIHGLFRLDAGPILTPLDNTDIPGLPANPLAIVETNGRLVVISNTYVYYSGPNDPEDLTPTVGGAGFQRIADRVPGDPIALTAIPNGFIVWTTQGAMIGEFVGGATVFRFYRMITAVLPLSAFGIVELPDGSHLIMSRLGLYRTVNGNQPEATTPLFNEFLRERFRHNPDLTVVLFFSVDENRLYVSMRDVNAVFTSTYALDLALDKWGIFSPDHLGVFTYAVGRGKVGYVDSDGVAHRFLSHTVRGRNRELASAPGTFTGLDSYIEVGYIRPTNLTISADTLQEIQEIVITRGGNSASAIQVVDEGLLSEPVLSTVDEGVEADLSAATVDFTIDESVEAVLLGIADYGVVIIGDTFVFPDTDDATIIPILAARRLENDLWVGMSAAQWHRLRLTAEADGEFFHAINIRATVGYTGHES